MNSVMGSILNENFGKKKRFVGLVNNAWDPLEKTEKRFLKKKKNPKAQMRNVIISIQTNT